MLRPKPGDTRQPLALKRIPVAVLGPNQKSCCPTRLIYFGLHFILLREAVYCIRCCVGLAIRAHKLAEHGELAT